MKKVRVVVEEVLQKDRKRMLACKICDECSQVTLLLPGQPVSFKQNNALASRHKIEKIPVKLWTSKMFLAS